MAGNLTPALAAVGTSHHPSALRNRADLCSQLQKVLRPYLARIPEGTQCSALEIGSGTGAHIELYAQAMPTVLWTPSEYVPPSGSEGAAAGKIGSAADGSDPIQILNTMLHPLMQEGVIRPALAIDGAKPVSEWPREATSTKDLVIWSNICHIAPWAVTQGLIAAAGSLLRPGGKLCIYGPFRQNGILEPESNVRFDEHLKGRNADWGIRDVIHVQREAHANGISLVERVPMPANNWFLHFEKDAV